MRLFQLQIYFIKLKKLVLRVSYYKFYYKNKNNS